MTLSIREASKGAHVRHRRKTTRKVNRRAVAMTITALSLGGAMLLGTPFASAGETTDADTVSFSGGCGLIGLLAPSSKPDPKTLEVAEGTEMTFTNKLGSNAVLHIGATTMDIAKDESKKVTLEDKSVEVAMIPKCVLEHGLFENMQKATITVKGNPDTPDPVDPAATPGNTAKPGNTTKPSKTATATPDSGSRPTLDPKRPAAEGAVPPDAGGNAPAAGSTPAPAGAAPGGGNAPGAGANGAPGTGAFAVEPVGGDVTNSGSTGLLALIATVCLVGVGAAAVRTVATQRSTAAGG